MIMLLVLTIIHLFCLTGGTSQVYVKTGENLTLDLTNADVPKDFEMLKLLNSSSSVLGIFSPGREPNMTSRAVFSSAKSVTLKNLQKSDSGEYSIKVTGNKDYRLPTYYSVTVQESFSHLLSPSDPVSPVSLKVSSSSSSSSSNKCTVICSTEDFYISSTFMCENQSCHQEGGERSKVTNTGASLIIHLNNSSIICNHSNKVSFTQNKTSIQSCFQSEEKGEELIAVG
ncbi:uncharacterized protein LOC119779965 [Cyprinodon tularosa]|uniref:uncharacterized protein LOC119779965 n=1 Tax=Cyprinodon tularosa TaxID=77115 RepID=UPI0018E2556E|nr:uncharacterized protein LOC119779965 [Cyprinodon tularosa]